MVHPLSATPASASPQRARNLSASDLKETQAFLYPIVRRSTSMGDLDLQRLASPTATLSTFSTSCPLPSPYWPAPSYSSHSYFPPNSSGITAPVFDSFLPSSAAATAGFYSFGSTTTRSSDSYQISYPPPFNSFDPCLEPPLPIYERQHFASSVHESPPRHHWPPYPLPPSPEASTDAASSTYSGSTFSTPDASLTARRLFVEEGQDYFDQWR